jgi:DNA ligase (NAD+)
MVDAPAPAEAQLEQTLAGQTFVITGTLDAMSREDAESAIERRGGKVSGSISRKNIVAGGWARRRHQTRKSTRGRRPRTR